MTGIATLVIAPGRGTYNKDELGYLARFRPEKGKILEEFDAIRLARQQEMLSTLDGSPTYVASKFTRGDNASALIHACAYLDYLSINRDSYDIVAVTGNSMGWYIALACAKALERTEAFNLTNTMGSLMQETLIGGQLVYPYVNEDWIEIPERMELLRSMLEEIPDLHLSIHLGGMFVFAGTESALERATGNLEKLNGRFPMRLTNHAGFHSPLQEPVSNRGLEMISADLFQPPEIPMIDGRGHVWPVHVGNSAALHKYTLSDQVVKTYDFTKSVQNSVREFAPDKIIILGPGSTLGSAVAQSLISMKWKGLASKGDFESLQKHDPFVLSMGIEKQRKLVV